MYISKRSGMDHTWLVS